jgi:hypothetical protein
MTATRLATLALLFASLSARAADDAAKPTTPPAAPAAELTDAEKKFTERMTNIWMTGHSTTGDAAPRPDKYKILGVKKLKGDDWLFTAQIKFGQADLAIPMTIPVKWAGDTAVISVTNWGLPGMGTYTARVLISEDQYAGTWTSHGNNPHGGHLWGKIVKDKEDPKPAAK